MKDLLKLFKTIIDFKGLPFLATKQSAIKTFRLLFFFCHGYECFSLRSARKNCERPWSTGSIIQKRCIMEIM